MSKSHLNLSNNYIINIFLKQKDYKSLHTMAMKLALDYGENFDKETYKMILEKLYEVKFTDAYIDMGLFYIYEDKQIEKGINIIKEAADLNYIDSLKYLGEIYYSGINVNEDLEKSIHYYEKAAILGDYNSIEMISTLYLCEMAPFNNLKSLNILNKGKKLNIKNSILCLAKYHETPSSIHFDFGLALKYKELCLDTNNLEDVKELAFAYLKRTSATNKYNKRMIELFEILTNNNDKDALNILGYFYTKGSIVEKDFNKAIKFYEKASHLGDLIARNEILNLKKKIEG